MLHSGNALWKKLITVAVLLGLLINVIFTGIHLSAQQISCPSGTGPGGITAGSYPPESLTQAQRQWLWNIFGNNSNENAPVGYGGQGCGGGNGGGTCPQFTKFGQGTYIILYEHANYEGRSVIVRAYNTQSNLQRLRFNDIASSICIVGPAKFKVCEHAYYQGACTTFDDNDPYLGDNAVGNDRASSVWFAGSNPKRG